MNNPWADIMSRPRNVESPEQMKELLDDYFKPGGDAWVEENEKMHFRPTVSGMALACGMHRGTFHKYEEREEFRDIIKRAKSLIEKAHEQKLYGSAVTGSIFMLKANFGWRDNDEVKDKETQDNHFNFTFNVAKDDDELQITRGKKS